MTRKNLRPYWPVFVTAAVALLLLPLWVFQTQIQQLFSSDAAFVRPRYKPIMTPSATPQTPPGGNVGKQVNPDTIATIVQKMKADLAARKSVAISSITVVRTTTAEWANGCMGVIARGVGCAQVVTPGYVVLLSIPDKGQFTYHADTQGNIVFAQSRFLR